MALSAAFRERLEHMEHTRNQRLSLLQAEKEVQENKSQALVLRIASMRATERRCLALDQKIASQSFKIWELRSEIDRLDEKNETDSHQLRVLKSEVEELEDLEKEKNRFYELKGSEMKEFKQNMERFAFECQMQVQDLKKGINELCQIPGSDRCTSDSEIAAAEMRKSELLAMKEELDRKLASNYQIRAQLQKQLQTILTKHKQDTSYKS
ncbi:myosin-9 [Prunus yedoensis var. nudiflora]|uniref:Myosin-9 n=1 Tax=Prunus yedoensis var. nudiflora TaxID=2094558 RepID=A0A314YUQ4_PRUYE|nr:myosin-9 [Prunus yedoensis var. nudiflora]